MKNDNLENKWIILRTAGRCTLPLARSLAEYGFDVWTPIEFVGKDGTAAPIAPTYLFARLDHLLDMLAMSETRAHRHEGFSVMRRPGGFAMCRDAALNGLRAEEAGRRPKPVANPKCRHSIAERYEAGERVMVPASGGGFVGLEGEVEASDGRYTDLYFGGSMRLKIETFKLRGDDVSENLIAA